jgi:release factor glutamine methyltransferase
MSETLVSIWTEARRELEAAGIEYPVFDARLLVEAGAGVARLDIITDPRRALSEAQATAVRALVARRAAREPVSQILGRKAFWNLDFAVTRDVLTPRPETELLVALALELIPADASARILDLGIGSGAILLSILAERPNAHGVGIDLSADALAVARANTDALGLSARAEFHHGGWDAPLGGRFDFVLSNPPYIPSAEIDTLEPEVARYEPRIALDGGADGLDAYRAIVPHLTQWLRPGGAYGFEIGLGQEQQLIGLLTGSGLAPEAPRLDLAGIPRLVWGRIPE